MGGYFVLDIEKATLENEDYRRVIYTPGYQQLVLMSIPVGQDIELEIHPEVDQFFRIERGLAEFHFGKDEEKVIQVKDGFSVTVQHGTYHRVVNIGHEPLKLYTIYSPPNHKQGHVDHVRPPSENKGNKYKKALLYLLTF
jgi:mannose-6-phosphate isomerase-like protein (cupin superfamily)